MTDYVDLMEQLGCALLDALYVATGSLEPDERNRIVNLVRKLRITRELSDAYYIAVAGSQGAGKTSLIRTLYDLDQQWLADNNGRGERLPVFVLEKDGIDSPVGCKLVVDDNAAKNGRGEIKEVKLTAHEFRRMTDGEGVLQDVLLLKLYVPRKYFLNGQAGFVLLPGYEAITEGNALWQDVMKHAVRHAMGGVLVTDAARIANGNQYEIKKDISNGFSGDATRKPVIAIAKTEDVRPEDMDGLIKRASELFEIDAKERDRIVLTGHGSPDYKHEVSRQLIAAIHAYKQDDASKFDHRLSELASIVDDEVYAIKSVIEGVVSSRSVTNSEGDRIRDNILEKFDKAAIKYRKTYEKALQANVGFFAKIARDAALKNYSEKEEGLYNHTKNFISRTSGAAERMNEDRIINAWRGAFDNSHAGYRALCDASVQSKLVVLSITNSKDVKTSYNNGGGNASENAIALIGYESSTATERVDDAFNADVRATLMRVFKPSGNETSEVLRDESTLELEKAMSLLPALAMEYQRINSAILLADPKFDSNSSDNKDVGHALVNAAKGLPEFNDSVKPVVKAVAAMLAIDIAADGHIDTIPALLNAVFPQAQAGDSGKASQGGAVATAGTASAAAAISVWAVGGLVVAYVGYQAMRAAQAHDASMRSQITMHINTMRENYVGMQLDSYDGLMETIRDRLYYGLGRAYGLDKELDTKDRLLRTITKLNNKSIDLVRSINAAKALA